MILTTSFTFKHGDRFDIPDDIYRDNVDWVNILVANGDTGQMGYDDLILSLSIEMEYKKRRWRETQRYLKSTIEEKQKFSQSKKQTIINQIIDDWRVKEDEM